MTDEEFYRRLEETRSLWDEKLKKEEAAKSFWKFTSFVLFLAVLWLTAEIHGWLRSN